MAIGVGEFLSMLKDKLGLSMIQSEIIEGELAVFKGTFSGGRVICGDYKVGISCHLYIQQKDIDPGKVEDDLDLLLTQKEVCSFLGQPSTGNIPDDQEDIENLVGQTYLAIAWDIPK